MLLQDLDNGRLTLTMDRPAVHNAFNAELIAALTEALHAAAENPDARVVVLTGSGVSFSAGADLNWMRAMADYSEADNLADSLKLAELMRVLNDLPKPTIARVQGSAFGGGVGLIACCDIAIGVSSAQFALSEAKLGLVPAVIAPYVVSAIGVRQARRYFQTAALFGAERAAAMGLLHDVVEAGDLNATIDGECHVLGKAGPLAQRAGKALVARIAGRDPALYEETAALIARLRVSDEGQEGLRAFLDKRRPAFSAPE